MGDHRREGMVQYANFTGRTVAVDKGVDIKIHRVLCSSGSYVNKSGSAHFMGIKNRQSPAAI